MASLQIFKVCFIGGYACLGKICAKTSFLYQNQIVLILKKRVVKQTLGGSKENSEIMTIPNKYKDTLDNLIDSLNAKSLD